MAAVQSETVLIQKVYTHFKKAPPTHKLGVLYVVDSVTRGWLDQARKSGQPIGPAAADGTFAAGVNHVTELLPSLMTDIINTAPEAQKVRFRDVSLITITRLDYMNVDKNAHDCSVLLRIFRVFRNSRIFLHLRPN